MKRNIVVSMLIIALSASLLGGATFAWFTDTVSADADFVAGTIDLGEPAAAALSIPQMAPGDTTSDWTITLQNAGTLDMYYRLYFLEDAPGGSILADVLEVYIDGNLQGTLASLIGEGNAIFDSATMSLASGAPSEALTITFHLPESADNTYQGATFSGSLVVEAAQVDNQDPANVQW